MNQPQISQQQTSWPMPPHNYTQLPRLLQIKQENKQPTKNAGDRTRTYTGFTPPGPKPDASANFATPATQTKSHHLAHHSTPTTNLYTGPHTPITFTDLNSHFPPSPLNSNSNAASTSFHSPLPSPAPASPTSRI